MPYDDYQLLRIDVKGGIATAIVDAPPINLMTLPLFGEISRFGAEIEDDESVRVVVLKSAHPEFFIAHFDVAAILDFPPRRPQIAQTSRAGTVGAVWRLVSPSNVSSSSSESGSANIARRSTRHESQESPANSWPRTFDMSVRIDLLLIGFLFHHLGERAARGRFAPQSNETQVALDPIDRSAPNHERPPRPAVRSKRAARLDEAQEG